MATLKSISRGVAIAHTSETGSTVASGDFCCVMGATSNKSSIGISTLDARRLISPVTVSWTTSPFITPFTRELQNRSQSVVDKGSEKSISANGLVARYMDTWKWDIVMFLQSLQIRVIDC